MEQISINHISEVMNLALVLDKPKKTLKIILMIVKKRIHFENEKAWSQGFVPKVGNMLEEISKAIFV